MSSGLLRLLMHNTHVSSFIAFKIHWTSKPDELDFDFYAANVCGGFVSFIGYSVVI
jgi:hypothetical protein